MSDAVNKPAHYNQGSIECIEAMKIVLTPEEFRGYLKGNVFKYLWREKDKNGIEDLKKAKWYLGRLIDSFEANEPEQPAWTPKIGDWVRIKKPLVGCWPVDWPCWTSGMDKYDKHVLKVYWIQDRVIIHNDRKFHFDWLEPAEQPKARAISDKIPQGYRKLGDSSQEPRQLGDLRWSVSEKRYIEISVKHLEYANRDNWAACRKVEPVVKDCLTPEPPDGWRWLGVGEFIRKGDQGFENGLFYAIDSLIGMTLQAHWMPIVRRNRFEVGEKVVWVTDDTVWTIHQQTHEGTGCPSYVVRSGNLGWLLTTAVKLAPYIEETK